MIVCACVCVHVYLLLLPGKERKTLLILFQMHSCEVCLRKQHINDFSMCVGALGPISAATSLLGGNINFQITFG